MATGVNVKMGVSGVSRFKQDMKQAQSSVKTLDEALKLNEKQFQATGDAEQYMQEKTELLQTKLEKQKQVVDSAKNALNQMAANGVDKASDSYQKMQQAVLKAEGDLLDTQNALNGVADASAEAASSAESVNDSLSKIKQGVSFQNVTEGIGKITDSMEAAFKKAIQLGKAITKEVLGAGSWADDLATKAAYYGLKEEDLQRMEKTANLIDTSVEAIVGARNKLKKGLGNNDKGVGEALTALFGEGFESGNWEDTFWKAGEALMKFTDEEKQEAYAQKLFGKSWHELIPLFQAGREEYENLNKSWSVVSQENLDNLKAMDDQYQKLSSEFETFKMTLLSSFAEPLTQGMEAVTGLFAELNKYLETPEGQAMIKQLGTTISTLIEDLTNINPEEVVNGLKGVIDGITDALKWITENKGTVVTAMGGIIAAWGAMKLTGGVLEILKIVNAITGLSAAEAAAAGTTAGSSWASAFASAAMKAAPFLAFLYTLLNPAASADNDADTLMDANGNLTGAGLIAQAQNGESLMIAPDTMHGKFTESQYQLLQDYWDKYRTGTATNEDWAGVQSEFKKSDAYWDMFVELAAQMYKLDRTLDDLPEDIFGNADKKQEEAALKDATDQMKKLPNAVADAVSRVGFVVELDGENVVAVINRRLGIKLAGE